MKLRLTVTLDSGGTLTIDGDDLSYEDLADVCTMVTTAAERTQAEVEEE
jgi:hypothetical protein